MVEPVPDGAIAVTFDSVNEPNSTDIAPVTLYIIQYNNGGNWINHTETVTETGESSYYIILRTLDRTVAYTIQVLPLIEIDMYIGF